MRETKSVLVGAALLVLFLTAPPRGMAQVKQGQGSPDSSAVSAPLEESPYYVGTGMGLDLPLSGWNENYYLGGGGSLTAGYKLDPSWAVQLEVDQWFFAGAGNSLYDLRIVPELRFLENDGALSPYLLAGFGYDLQFSGPSGYSTSAPAGLVGLGVQCNLRKGSRLFLETRYSFLFYDGTTAQDIPVVLGLSEDL